MIDLINDPGADLFGRIPHGNGQTILREALLVADHNAYHLGQLRMPAKHPTSRATRCFLAPSAPTTSPIWLSSWHLTSPEGSRDRRSSLTEANLPGSTERWNPTELQEPLSVSCGIVGESASWPR